MFSLIQLLKTNKVKQSFKFQGKLVVTADKNIEISLSDIETITYCLYEIYKIHNSCTVLLLKVCDTYDLIFNLNVKDGEFLSKIKLSLVNHSDLNLFSYLIKTLNIGWHEKSWWVTHFKSLRGKKDTCGFWQLLDDPGSL